MSIQELNDKYIQRLNDKLPSEFSLEKSHGQWRWNFRCQCEDQKGFSNPGDALGNFIQSMLSMLLEEGPLKPETEDFISSFVQSLINAFDSEVLGIEEDGDFDDEGE